MKRSIKKYKVGDAYEEIVGGGMPGVATFAVRFDVHYETTDTVQNSDGTISIKTTPHDETIQPISDTEFQDFLGEYYDWNFLYKRNEYTDPSLYAISKIWERFIEHNRDNFTRALQDMFYEYNPIFNYDRNEVHYYNVHDSGKDTATGTMTHTITDNGTETRETANSNATSDTTSYGVGGGASTSDSYFDSNGKPKSDASVGTSGGSDFVTQTYANSFESDDVSVAGDKQTQSTKQAGSLNDNIISAGSSMEKTSFNNRQKTDTLTENNHGVTKKNTRLGEEGTKAVGNIGVTTSTAMVAESVAFRMKTNVASLILEKFAKEYFFIGVDDDDDYDWYK